ncbi:hypothetical protein PC129_g21203 [Phytophthora cactorum]|uniref:Uncharacterized protein n=1 Tax=Phytophthora cactorum TaxID=29920 RepID=A0A8T1AJT1_9STRA|nr:hypothetical protein Pcac1_g5203 [Phytophthora cactorum]KAG2796484.1 hypothetical protein PC111_g21704 [Phytophthora cactorum]KAG2819796.1 hypothetical protein PC112_g12049 [Phytophthora cactorum]KAG2855450.1 hypothetical protein PC113_g12425 [Phytophthora cactorum]KAG2875720.1 hypothetical protein PC114_g24569 [Phytophthora cactorum]
MLTVAKNPVNVTTMTTTVKPSVSSTATAEAVMPSTNSTVAGSTPLESPKNCELAMSLKRASTKNPGKSNNNKTA